MKKFQILLAAAFCGVIFSVATNASAQNGSATVVRVEGMVSYSLGNDQWVPLVAGKIMPVGAVVRTDHNGVADIVLGKDINLPQNASQSSWEPSYIAQHPDAKVRGMA